MKVSGDRQPIAYTSMIYYPSEVLSFDCHVNIIILHPPQQGKAGFGIGESFLSVTFETVGDNSPHFLSYTYAYCLGSIQCGTILYPSTIGIGEAVNQKEIVGF